MDPSADNDNRSSDLVRVSKVNYDSSTVSPFGEIVEASTTYLLAQCHRLYAAPSLGDLVRTEEDSTAFYLGQFHAPVSYSRMRNRHSWMPSSCLPNDINPEL